MARQFRTPIQFSTGTNGPTIQNADGTRSLIWGSGTPESAVSASVGTLYLRTDGSTGTTLYTKESGTGNTGWVAIGSASFPLEHMAAAGTDETLNTEVTADANKRFILTAGGMMDWGDGTAIQDTNLYRSAADTLRTDDTLLIGAPGTAAGSAVTIDGTQTLTNKTITAATNNIAARSLHSATTVIDVASAAAPSSGQVLTATSSTVATWQTAAASGVSEELFWMEVAA